MRKGVIVSKVKIFLDLFRVILCLPLGYFLYCIKNIYIISERGTDARDNGYHLFKYIVKNHPEVKIYYIIDKKSSDYNKVALLGRVIDYRSWKHVLYYITARKKISSHIMGYAPGLPYYFQKLQRYLKVPGKHIFLQHGVIMNDPVDLHADQAYMDLFVCGAKTEYDFVKNIFGHPEGVVKYTGLARYDNLYGHTAKDEIVIMPTWRKYLSNLNQEEFVQTEYYLHWDEVLRDPQLTGLLRENNIKLFFYPHYELQKFVNCFQYNDENIVIANFDDYDVQQLLVNAKLLITDYSSVFFDFAYMKKPCIYYQFDKERFCSQHYKKGYFDYAENGFGETVASKAELLEAIKESISLNFTPKSKFLKRMDDFFELHDNHNCERIYDAIEALK